MRWKAVVCDVDGTITDSRRHIQPLGIEMLRRAQERGCVVILASGNVLPITYGLSVFIGLDGPVVAENGGMVSYRDQVHTLFSIDLPLQAYEHLNGRLPGLRRLYTDQWRRTEVTLVRDLDLERVKELLQDWPLEVEATGFAIHLMQRGHSKMAGVRKACQLLGLDPSEAAAFGDSDNDASMLSGCGFGVAVGNASPTAREAADLVTEGHHAEGLREGLKVLGLL
jgi:phosphoglycolate phosphatase (TIGR01487 family)